METKKIKINFHEYNYKCGDGCCDHYGIITTLNGKDLQCHNTGYETIVEQILEHLGYKVEITNTDDFDDD